MSSSVSISSSTPVSPFQGDYEKTFSWLDPYEQKLKDFWANEYKNNSDLTHNVVNQYLQNSTGALNDLSKYENLFDPTEANMLQQANTYASPAGQQFYAGQAIANQAQAANAARNNSLQRLEAYGVNPGSSSFAALDRAAEVQAGAAEAAAGTQAAQQTRERGLQMEQQATANLQQSQAVNLGYRNAASQGLAGAENSTLSNMQAGTNAMGTPASLLAANKFPGVGNASSSVSTSQRSNPSSGSGGSGGDYSSSPLSSGESATEADPNWAGDSAAGYQGGGGGGGYGAGPADWGGVTGDYAHGGAIQLPTTGGHVPESASPSHGQQVDDIPARLNAGEFVIPRDVTAYYGHKHMLDLIKKARAAMGRPDEPVGPKMKPALNQAPTFSSQAINLG